MKSNREQRDSWRRQIAIARAIVLVLALVNLLLVEPATAGVVPSLFLGSYLLVALLVAIGDRIWEGVKLRLPMWLDVLALAAFLILSPSVVAFWFLYVFVVFAAATRWDVRWAMMVAAGGATALAIETALRSNAVGGHAPLRWLILGLATLAAGSGVSFLGGREQRHALRDRLLERLAGLLQVEKGLAESIRQMLGELALAFECARAFLIFRDEELDRLFVWQVILGEQDQISPETLPLTRAGSFFAEELESSICWNSLNGNPAGFGWDRRTRGRIAEAPRPAEQALKELKPRSILAVTLEAGGRPAGRVLLLDGRKTFTAQDLRWLERLVRLLEQPLENIFLLRHLRARAVEAERSRISRDLHDGVLQTLLSLDIQLEVLRRKITTAPEKVETELAALQKTVRQESAELRRMVTDLRPLRVESADLAEMMLGFAERFRNEAGLAVDLFVDNRDLRIPDRVCREIFQIYRESLHNVKKHAQASHVVVKLEQDEARVILVVDDNGQGFSFAGRFGSEELDRLRLGPISIKERCRSVGGMLTVESSPGHGARLTIEIPLS